MKILKVLSFAALLGFLLGWPLLVPGQYNPKAGADAAKKTALTARSDATSSEFVAAGAADQVATTMELAEKSAEANWNQMTPAQQQTYQDKRALALVQFSAGLSRHENGLDRTDDGDDRYAAGNENYAANFFFAAQLCYKNSNSPIGAFEYHVLAKIEYDAAYLCYSQALTHAQAAGAATQP